MKPRAILTVFLILVLVASWGAQQAVQRWMKAARQLTAHPEIVYDPPVPSNVRAMGSDNIAIGDDATFPFAPQVRLK